MSGKHEFSFVPVNLKVTLVYTKIVLKMLFFRDVLSLELLIKSSVDGHLCLLDLRSYSY